jgi:hypothetical protein
MAMNQESDPGSVAKTIIDTNIYMVLGTADETGLPWTTPVYFGSRNYTDFYWVSSPTARHSLNIAVRPRVSIVIFDSRAPIGRGQGVYMETLAEELTGADLATGIDIYSQASIADGASAWSLQDVTAPAPYRLYRATASRHWILDREGHPDRRMQVTFQI